MSHKYSSNGLYEIEVWFKHILFGNISFFDLKPCIKTVWTGFLFSRVWIWLKSKTCCSIHCHWGRSLKLKPWDRWKSLAWKIFFDKTLLNKSSKPFHAFECNHYLCNTLTGQFWQRLFNKNWLSQSNGLKIYSRSKCSYNQNFFVYNANYLPFYYPFNYFCFILFILVCTLWRNLDCYTFDCCWFANYRWHWLTWLIRNLTSVQNIKHVKKVRAVSNNSYYQN